MKDFLNRYGIWIFGVFALVLIYRVASLEDKKGIPAPVDDAVFQAEIVNSTAPVLVKFGATWCGPCRVMDKSLEEYETSLGSATPKVKVVRLDIDENPKLASHYGVSSIPQTFVFSQGKVIGHKVGALDATEIRDWVDRLVQ